MVNTERGNYKYWSQAHYNILNIVVNTELVNDINIFIIDYNILNIVVNTELED